MGPDQGEPLLYATSRRFLFAAAFAGATVAMAGAQDMADRPDFPTTEFAEGADRTSVTVGELTATITMVRRADIDPDADMPLLTVTVGGAPVLDVPGIVSGFDFPLAEASIAEIDPGNHHREVLFSSYSGGAHCCSTVIVAEEVGDKWVAVPIGEFDGDGNLLDDLDGDGLAEIATADNRFLYKFDCYACSAAPLIIFTVRGGAAVEVSSEPRYLAAHRDWLDEIEQAVEPAERWASPGFLAGWLAGKARVGGGAAAWAEINARWDFAEDPGEQTCLTGGEPETCAKRALKVLSFPERLKLFLDETGYRF